MKAITCFVRESALRCETGWADALLRFMHCSNKSIGQSLLSDRENRHGSAPSQFVSEKLSRPLVGILILQWSFGLIPGRGNRPLVLTNADGSQIVLALSGKGIGHASMDLDNSLDLSIEQSLKWHQFPFGQSPRGWRNFQQ